MPAPFVPEALTGSASEGTPSLAVLPATPKQPATKASVLSFQDPADTSSLLSYELVLVDAGSLVEPVPATLLFDETEPAAEVLPKQNNETSKNESSKGKKKKFFSS